MLRALDSSPVPMRGLFPTVPRYFSKRGLSVMIGILIAWKLINEIFMLKFFSAVHLLEPEMNYR